MIKIMQIRKIVKVIQYIAVVIGEWRLVQGHRSHTGSTDWDKRFRVLGKSLSTIRMSMRIANCLEGIKYFLSLRKRDPESIYNNFRPFRALADPADTERGHRARFDPE